MPESWSIGEVELIIEDYFSMYSSELLLKPYNKTEHRNKLKLLLNNRSDGSVEKKHQNISAVLINLGLPFIKGYKPLWNYQLLLEEKVNDFLFNHQSNLEQRIISFTDAIPFESDKELILDSPPEKQLIKEPNSNYNRKPFKINYLEREQQNSVLGSKGEELVIRFEERRLRSLGREDLVREIEWIARYDDGAGYDIFSKNEDGSDRYIEVKTTKLSKETPIFFSKREFDFSIKYREQFNLYRLFNFNDQPKMFNLQGSYDDFCRKEILQYKGRFL